MSTLEIPFNSIAIEIKSDLFNKQVIFFII